MLYTVMSVSAVLQSESAICMCVCISLSISIYILSLRVSLVAQLVKNPPARQEIPVQFLGWEDPLEKGMATHSSILAWRIPWTV